MANRRIDNSAGTKIRQYVSARIRKAGEKSESLPSSYELAEMFGTTRRVARYELERLVAQGILISKPRIGTFTNPLKNYINVTPVQKKMPLIGVIDGDGSRFCYGRAENLIYNHIGLALTERSCYVHYLSFSCSDDDSRLQELKALGLDGIIWYKPINRDFPSAEFLSRVEQEGIPVVAVTYSPFEFSRHLELSFADAEEKLAGIFKKERREKILMLSNLPQEQEIAQKIATETGLPDTAVKSLDEKDPFSVKVGKLTELLKTGYRPDAVVCDAMFAETVPELLAAAGIDMERECRLVACNEVNSEENFRGFVIAPDPAETARTAVRMLSDIRAGKTPVTPRILPCRLNEIPSVKQPGEEGK